MSGLRAEYSSRNGVVRPAAVRVRIIDISGTIPLPPASSSTGSGRAGSQTNQPPMGPRSSSG